MSVGDPGRGFPAACLRGIRIQKWIAPGPDGSVLTAEAYSFEQAARTGQQFEGWREASINWEDDEMAVSFTKGQRALVGSPLNPHGVGRLLVSDIETCRTISTIGKCLSYERRDDADQPDNRYHGNLLLDPALPRQFQRRISGMLGLCTVVVP